MPTATELLDLEGIGQRASEVRFDVLNQTLGLIGTIDVDSSNPARIGNNTSATIKRTVSGVELPASVQADIDPFGDRLRPMWILENGDEYPLGVFILGGIDRKRWEWGLDADVTGVDQLLILDQPLERSVGYPVGYPIYDALVELFDAANVPAFSIDPGIGTLLANPIVWAAGDDTTLKVINDLAALAGAYAAYFDNSGTGRVTLVPDLAASIPTLIYDSGGRILDGSMVETDNALEAPNRFIVIESGNPDTPIVGVYDIPDDAPNSALNRGFVVSSVIAEQGLGTELEARTRARAAAAQASGTYEWVQFSSPPDPRHDTFDPVLYLGSLYRELAWSLPLREGSEMSHDLRRVYGGE